MKIADSHRLHANCSGAAADEDAHILTEVLSYSIEFTHDLWNAPWLRGADRAIPLKI